MIHILSLTTKWNFLLYLFLIFSIVSVSMNNFQMFNFVFGNSTDLKVEADPFIGVNVRGLYTDMTEHDEIQNSNFSKLFPANYYDASFRTISGAGMNHIRYTLFWE